MKKTNKSLQELMQENKNSSAFVCLSMFLYAKNYPLKVVEDLFDKYVPKEDYRKKDRELLIGGLMKTNQRDE